MPHIGFTPFQLTGLIIPTQSLMEKRKAPRCSCSKEAHLSCKDFSEPWASQPLTSSPWKPGLGYVYREGRWVVWSPHPDLSHGGVISWEISRNAGSHHFQVLPTQPQKG